eukprot:1196214-Prorocentrum_minimum.AAC.1
MARPPPPISGSDIPIEGLWGIRKYLGGEFNSPAVERLNNRGLMSAWSPKGRGGPTRSFAAEMSPSMN